MTEEERKELLAAFPQTAGFAGAVLRMSPEEAKLFLSCEIGYSGHCGTDDAFLYYYDIQTFSFAELELPETRVYRVEVIDTWNMTRETAAAGVNGKVRVDLPSREYMAVLAVAEN